MIARNPSAEECEAGFYGFPDCDKGKIGVIMYFAFNDPYDALAKWTLK